MSIRRISLVDDNNIFCFIFEKLLERYEGDKVEILRFEHGQSALEYFQENRDCPDKLPELVFVDINMPILTGWELLDALVAHESPIISKSPFFIVSSSDNNIDISKANEYPFIKEYLNKPLDKNRLYSILDQYLTT